LMINEQGNAVFGVYHFKGCGGVLGHYGIAPKIISPEADVLLGFYAEARENNYAKPWHCCGPAPAINERFLLHSLNIL
jgi:hypothetical protein